MTDLTPTEITLLAAVVGALGLLWRIYANINQARRDLVRDVKEQIQAETASAAAGVLTRLSPDPLNVREADRFATHEEHVELCRRVEVMEASMDRGFDKLAVDGSRRAANINGRVDVVAQRVAAVDERSQMTNARLAQVDAKIDRILERLQSS
jgi:hypothetical protein